MLPLSNSGFAPGCVTWRFSQTRPLWILLGQDLASEAIRRKLSALKSNLCSATGAAAGNDKRIIVDMARFLQVVIKLESFCYHDSVSDMTARVGFVWRSQRAFVVTAQSGPPTCTVAYVNDTRSTKQKSLRDVMQV